MVAPPGSYNRVVCDSVSKNLGGSLSYLFDITTQHDLELTQYMEEARPGFTQDALCKGSIFQEIDEIKKRYLATGKGEPFDMSTTFFPSRGGASKVAAAKKVCKECPVQWDCFEYGYEGREQAGIWGGSSVDQRESCYKKHLEPEEAFVEIFGKKQFLKKT